MSILRISKSSVLLLCLCVVFSLFFLLHWIPKDHPPCPEGVLVKCLPIVFLCLYVGTQILHSGISRYSACILLGLLFSGTGDTFLVYHEEYFIHGVVAFAIAHLFYIVAFHEPPMWWKFMAFYIPYNGIMWSILMPRLSLKLFIFGFVYGNIITIMLWRAVARLDFNKPSNSKLSVFVGAFLFLVSDTVLTLNKFAAPLPYAQYTVMTTYYMSQLLIAVSVVKEIEKPETNFMCTDGLKKKH